MEITTLIILIIGLISFFSSRDRTEFTKLDKKRYMKSTKWSTLRAQILERDNYTCQGCKTPNIPLEIHHITYKRLGNEKHNDLVSLCRNCHQSVHDRYGYSYNNEFPVIITN